MDDAAHVDSGFRPSWAAAGREASTDAVIGVTKRDLIIEAAVELSSSEEFDTLSVLDICIAAGVSISSFYHWFGSKDALLRACHLRYLEMLQDRMVERAQRLPIGSAGPAELIERAIGDYVDIHRALAAYARPIILAEQRHPELGAARHRFNRDGLARVADMATAHLSPEEAVQRREDILFVAKIVVLVTQDLVALRRVFVGEGTADDETTRRLVRLAVALLAPN